MILYNVIITVYGILIALVSPFNKKAGLWLNGRKNVIGSTAAWREKNPGKLIWFHCASLGEFEQGRPVMEAIKKHYPQIKIAITFFSPSGYEIRKNYTGADYICYLPNDSLDKPSRFVNALNPTCAIFVKYEYWPGYFKALKRNHVPLLMISAILRPDQRFFGLFKNFWTPVLQCVDHYFVQNEETKRLLNQAGINAVTISGDNRFDRVIQIVQASGEIPEIKQALEGKFSLVAGSTWPQDEAILKETIEAGDSPIEKLVLVPHETDEKHISAIRKLLPEAVLWSERNAKDLKTAKVIVIDTIGMLTMLYQYGTICYVGGGFGKGIHNTLEAAVWGKPLVFGSNIRKFEEAKAMVEHGGATVINHSDELRHLLRTYARSQEALTAAGNKNHEYVGRSAGATKQVIQHLEKVGILKK